MNTTSKNNTQSNWIISSTIKILPWILLSHNLLYMILGNNSSATSDFSLASGNFIGIAYLICIQWAISRDYISA